MLSGAGWWLAIQVAAMAPDLSCRYADVVVPSYSTTTRRLPYGLMLSSSTAGRPLAGRPLVPLARLLVPVARLPVPDSLARA
jgi:hypothetical protein